MFNIIHITISAALHTEVEKYETNLESIWKTKAAVCGNNSARF